ncbi:MAG: ABC transporter substrate-binding protein [Dehalococcoidia bacterium]|nr:ABC transporter substrate-binding protein [Dehalococcoidia bacterium]
MTGNNTFDRRLRRRGFLTGSAAAAMGAAALPLVGCGDDDDDGGGDPTETTTAVAPGQQTATATASVQVKKGGTWIRGAGGNIALASLPYMDAGTLAGGGNAAAREPGLIWGNLVRFGKTEVKHEPDHAKEWELSPDGKSMRFVLRDDIYYHSGRQFTTKDIAFNLEEVKKDKWKTSVMARLNPVAEYKIVDDFTMEWTLIRPNAPVLDFMAVFRCADMDTIEEIAAGKLVGTGAFKWSNYDPVKGATLEANERYHLGRPHLDKIEYIIFADAAALAIALETGQILDSALSAEESIRFYDNDDFNTVTLPGSGGTTPMGMRTDLDPLKDKRVRQAIELLLDRERYREENFVGRFDELGRLPWPTFSPAYDAELDKPVYDPQKAKDLMREAGLASGITTTVKMNTLPIRPYSPAIAQLLQQEAREIGIKIEFEPLEYANMLDRYYKGALDNVWIGFGDSGSPLSPGTSLLFATLTDGAVTHYDDPEYLAARKAIVEGGTDYKRFNQAYLDGAFAPVIARPVGVNFEAPEIHIARNVLGWVDYHEVWIG